MRKSLILAAAAAVLAAPVASAWEPGDFYMRLGATNIDPDDPNGDIDLTAVDPALGKQDIEVDDSWGVTFTGSYQWKENWAIEVLAAVPYEHDIELEDLGKVGETKHLPPTVTLQYHFLPDGKFQPYVGAGINYTIFFDDGAEGALEALGGDLEIDDNSFGLAGQIGFDYMLNDRWFLNLDFRYISIETDAKVTIPGVGTIKEDVDINPFLYGINVGYKF
jgi:outer membrane protein